MTRDTDQAPKTEVETTAKRPWTTPVVIASEAASTEAKQAGATSDAAHSES